MTMKPFIRLGTWKSITFSVHWMTFFFVGCLVVCGAFGEFGLPSGKNTLLFALAWFLSVAIHDGAHLLAAKMLRHPARARLTASFCLLPTGSYYVLPATGSRYRDALIAMAGPAASGLAALGCLYLMQYTEDLSLWDGLISNPDINLLTQLFALNLLLSALNLVPLFPMDGARVLRCALTFFANRGAATRIILAIGRPAALAISAYGALRQQWDLAILGIYILLATGASNWTIGHAHGKVTPAMIFRKNRHQKGEAGPMLS